MKVEIDIVYGARNLMPSGSSLDRNIAAQEKAVGGRSLSVADFVLLGDTLSILEGLKAAIKKELAEGFYTPEDYTQDFYPGED